MPARAGVVKEGQAALMNYLKKNGYLSVGTDKAKLLELTAKGRKARDEYPERVAAVEERWARSFGGQTVGALRTGLEAILCHPRFATGLEPHAAVGGCTSDTWPTPPHSSRTPAPGFRTIR